MGLSVEGVECWKEAASRAMDRYACGDESAFAEIYDLLAPRLSSFFLRRTRDVAQAEDLLQQTFLQMHCARQHFARGADVMPWAFAIARRLLIDAYRKSGRELLDCDEEIGRESTPPSQTPDRLAGKRQLARRIDEELTRVPEAHRAAFDLVQRDGLSMAEAAEVLGTTVAAVKLRAHRAYEALRAALGDDVRDELEGSS
jgi:RNA polymerase sigma-70 factor (ECF subfamily)